MNFRVLKKAKIPTPNVYKKFKEPRDVFDFNWGSLRDFFSSSLAFLDFFAGTAAGFLLSLTHSSLCLVGLDFIFFAALLIRRPADFTGFEGFFTVFLPATGADLTDFLPDFFAGEGCFLTTFFRFWATFTLEKWTKFTRFNYFQDLKTPKKSTQNRAWSKLRYSNKLINFRKLSA